MLIWQEVLCWQFTVHAMLLTANIHSTIVEPKKESRSPEILWILDFTCLDGVLLAKETQALF